MSDKDIVLFSYQDTECKAGFLFFHCGTTVLLLSYTTAGVSEMSIILILVCKRLMQESCQKTKFSNGNRPHLFCLVFVSFAASYLNH